MGAACCVAAKDRTITNRANNDALQQNARCSPQWSIRWDNRVRIAGEDTSLNGLSGGVSRNNTLEIISGRTVGETAHASEEGSRLDQGLVGQESPKSDTNAGILTLPSLDPSKSRNVPEEVKESTESPAISDPPTLKISPSAHSVSSFSASPFRSRSPLRHASSTPSHWPHRSPTHQLLRQVSDSQIPGHKSPNFSISEETSFPLPGHRNEYLQGTNDGSSDGCSLPAFPECMETSHSGEMWSFDSESSGFYCESVTRSSSQLSAAPSIDIHSCGVCSKPLTEKSSWHSYELAVVSVLICGHVYHAECLEEITAEINKYDPICPVCTSGEMQALKLSGKGTRAGMNVKARNKRSRKRVGTSDLDGDSVVFDGQRSSGLEGNGLKMIASSSMKSSLGKPFLRRHFSIGSKGSRNFSENHSARKKGFFWAKSCKE